tara:strand:- start:28 stop:1251 length:1224 start_codon:yes stop_codon:yes gene_type:complete
MTLEPISNTNIMVGYISETEGYVRGLLVPEANEYEKNNPNTIFIFIDGDDRVKYLNIDEVNSLRNSDLLRKDPCLTGPQPCGPPKLKFFGGGGVGAEANPVIDENGEIIAVDIISGGFGYESPPSVQVIDPCQNGAGAVLKTEILNGSVVRVIIGETGSGYLPPSSSVPQYPAIVQISDVIVTNPGIDYNCGVDEIVIEPANGTQLSYNCDPFGKIKSVKVLKSGNFTSTPKIMMKSDTGLNARFSPVFNVIRDPLPVDPIISDIVQVFDLVGLNVNGYVGGKEYYGNVYFKNGVKFAGTSVNSGTNIRVFETREASISGVNVPVARVNRVDETIETTVISTTDSITVEPDVVTPTRPTSPSVTVDPTPSTSVTVDPTPSPAPDPTPYTPPSTDSGSSSGGGGGYGY